MIHRAFRNPDRIRRFVPMPPSVADLDRCYQYCQAIAGASHRNYPVGSGFVPPELRRHIWAVYAFARVADDFADEPEYEGRRHVELDAWEDQLRAVYFEEQPTHPVFVALADTVDRFELPITELTALLSGFRLDLSTDRYDDFEDLRRYFMLAAAPVGHLYLTMAGETDARMHAFADELACSLSIARLLQDVPADLQRGRVYIPADDLYHFGVSADDLRAGRLSANLDALIRFEVARARAHLSRARPLVDGVGAALGMEMALMWHGCHLLLDRIERAGAGVLTDRPALTAIDKARALTSALVWRRRAHSERRTWA